MTPDKRRKVLSDIGNVELPKRRRNSLGFDMVSIEKTHDFRPNTSDSYRMKEVPCSISSIRSLVNSTSRETNIPSIDPKKRIQRLQALVNTKNSLHAKSQIPSDFKPPKRENEVEKEDSLIARQKLTQEIRDLKAEMDTLRHRLEERKRHSHILKHQISDFDSRLSQIHSHFELKSDSITWRIQHKEQSTELELKQLEDRLEDEFNRQKFEVRNDIMNESNFEDTESLKKLETLAKRKEELEQELEVKIAEKEEAVRSEKEAHKDKLDELDQEAEQRRASVVSKNDKIKTLLEQLHLKLDLVTAQKERKENELQELRQRKEELTSSLSNPNTSMEGLEQILRLKQTELLQLRNEVESWADRLSEQRRNFETAKNKYENYLSVHRTLEDAIMSFDTRPRTYMIVPAGLDIKIANERQLTVKERSFNFSKVFYCDDDLISQHWENFVQRSLTQHNVTMIFAGTRRQNLSQSLAESLNFLQHGAQRHEHKGWTFTFSLQSISISTNGVLDLLDLALNIQFQYENGRLIDIQGNKHNISLDANIKNIQKNSYVQPGAMEILHVQIHAINEKAKKRFTNQLSLVDISSRPLKSQAQTVRLESSIPQEKEFLNHVRKHTKCLYVCEVEDVKQDTIELLASISQL